MLKSSTRVRDGSAGKRIGGAWARYCLVVVKHWAFLLFWMIFLAVKGDAQDAKVQTTFKVKFVAEGAVYLEGGRDAGLSEGQRLTISRGQSDESASGDKGTAEVRVLSVASASAVAEILSSDLEIHPGDTATLSGEDAQKLALLHASKEARKYPQVITFTEGDPMDEEVREYLPPSAIAGSQSDTRPHRGGIQFDQGTCLFGGRAKLVSDRVRVPGRHEPYRRELLGPERILPRPVQFADEHGPGDHQRPSQSNLPPGLELQQSRFALGCRLRALLPSMGEQPGHHRRRLRGAPSREVHLWHVRRFRTRSYFVELCAQSPDRRRIFQPRGRQLRILPLHHHGWSRPSRGWTGTRTGSTCSWRTAFFYKRYLSIYHILQSDLLLGSTPQSPAPAPPIADTSSPQTGPVLSRDFLTVRIQPFQVRQLRYQRELFP